MDLNQPNVKIQVFIREQTEVGEYADALYYTAAEFAAASEKDVAGVIAVRVSSYVDGIKNPKPFIRPTKEMLQKEAALLQADLDAVNAKISGAPDGGK